MTFLVLFFWFIIFSKKFLFWSWLWQLKEYHRGRFLDHFRTDKGKKLIFSPLLALKTIVLLGFIFYPGPLPAYLVLALFSLEFVFSSVTFFKRKLKIPVLTRKTGIILSAGLSFGLLTVSFLSGARIPFREMAFILLIIDILAPLISTVLVLVFQPLTVALRDRLLEAAKKRREAAKNLLVIGITGSYGKTSMKEFLATILAGKYRVLKTKEHQNSEVGIAKCIIDNLQEDHEIFVVEMGAYNKGGINLLTNITKPKMGILTGINEQHMATFGSLKKTISAKFELIESLPEDGLAILNYDDPRIKKQKVADYNSRLKNVKFYSLFDKEADVWSENLTVERECVRFKVKTKDGQAFDFQLNSLGPHNVRNFLGAVCCAKYLGMSLSEINLAAAEINKQQSGMELKKGINGLNVIDATYSANPTGIMAHLDYLKLWPGKRIIIMPCLIELGKASKKIHKEIGRKIAEVCDLAIVTTKDRFKELKEGAEELPKTQPREKQIEIVFMEKPKDILKKIKDVGESGDIVLLESRVPGPLIDSLIK